MNKKNKNKNRSKPTNPAPVLQKVELAQNVEEDITEEKSVSLFKESDSVIQVTKESKDPAFENDEMSSGTPKKPKRNKGKKKKQEETNLELTKSATNEDSTPALPPVIDSDVKVKDESLVESVKINVEEESKDLEENVTANVRKKKNKKKPHEDQKVDEPFQDIDFVNKMQEELTKLESNTDKVECDVTSHEVEESDIKQTKKKNKKKKHRHDSERSDKADEVVICTAAFQKLISATDNEGDTSADTNVVSSKNSGECAKNVSSSVEEETLKDLIQSVLLPDESKQFQNDELQCERVNEPKNKKKSKKDKKQQQLKLDTEKSNLTEETTIQQEPLVVSSNIGQDLSQESVMGPVECESKDILPKAKAKIAKPVEKKRKGKAEIFEDHQNKQGEVDAKNPPLEIENVPEHISITDPPIDLNVQYTDQMPKVELKNENEVHIMTSEPSLETQISSDIVNQPIEIPIVERNVNLADVNIGIKSTEAKSMCSDVTQDLHTLKSEKDLKKITIEPMFSSKVPEKKESIPLPVEPFKTVEKKKKKSPKKIDVSTEKSFENKVLTTPESESSKEKTPLLQKQDSGLPSLSPNVDNSVEISSLKTDDLDGSPGAIPDFIHHPLATSQQLIDDNNNNTIIREISSTEEKLNLHLSIPAEPIIQDSGETPEPMTENISKSSPILNMTRERSIGNEPEKTDLKSKMMEVSQDMEELRLSIERSLAELTSMERNEEDIVKEDIVKEVIVKEDIVKEDILKQDIIKEDIVKFEDIEVPELDTKTEIKSCDVKNDESNKPLSENISSDVKMREIHTTTEAPKEKNDSETQKQEIFLKSENILKNQQGMPEHAKSDEQKHVDEKAPPQAPARKDNKGRGKGKRKGKQEIQSQQTTTVSQTTTAPALENVSKEVKKQEKEQQEQKTHSSESNENKGKQQQEMQLENSCNGSEQLSNNDPSPNIVDLSFEPIENFEDALTSSVDDVNKTFDMIANEVNNTPELTFQNPQINITSPTEDTETAEPKQNPVSPPKNLLGHPDIPVPSNRTDYKKERNKPPNMRHATVKIKDAVDIEKIEKTKQSKESQTENKKKIANNKNVLESFSYITDENAEYVYKYSFRKVFLQSLCHVCRKKLGQRVPCQFCSLVFYCSQKHKDEDWAQHQSFCFAICTITHLKDQKHIYADAKNLTGQNYRLLRMQMIISCEKVLKRKLVPWEQEALLYPRMCTDVTCREWRQSKLADCDGCGQISYCSENPMHLLASHQRWCKSYGLYQKLVHHQQTTGRLEPKLPNGVVAEGFRIPEKINEILAAMYDEKIDMTDIEYAALTQLATAPLTAAYSHQLATTNHSNGMSKKTSFVVHIVGAELQFEADVLFKWELFFLHLKPHVQELRVVLVSPDLNPSNLPLNLLGKVNLCESCRLAKRRVLFSFQDKKNYYEYWASDEFFAPDIVCAFNPSIQRSSMYYGKDTWPTTVSCILKLKIPFIISSYSMDELNRDITRIKECSELSGISFKTITDPQCNPFASVRPDRNFITDDETPLLFKNYCFVVLCGV